MYIFNEFQKKKGELKGKFRSKYQIRIKSNDMNKRNYSVMRIYMNYPKIDAEDAC